MNIRRIAARARKIFPPFVFQVLRRFGSAFLTPLFFSGRSGHFRSALLGKAVGRDGKAIPWYNYPAIEFLCGKDFKEKNILEWGAGQSTLWWAARAKEVTAFENDPAWQGRIAEKNLSNVRIQLMSREMSGAADAILGKKFDLVIIDGLDRLKAASVSIGALSEDGAVLLDNSDQPWSSDGSFPILELFRRSGFQRVDFFGYAPGVVQPHCSSLFFRQKCFLFSGDEPPKGLTGD